MTQNQQSTESIYSYIESKALESGVFEAVKIDERGVRCKAIGSAEPAFYRVEVINEQVWVLLETEDRWLSGSIEGDLAGTGDDLDDLLEEEIVDQGHSDAKLGFEHFRSPEMLYTFRSLLNTPIHEAQVQEHALMWLLGYEIVFRELGDMSESDDD